MRLLAIRMVASNSLGLLLKEMSILSLLFLLFRSTSKSGGFSEKKAVSDPETNPEERISKSKTMNPGNTPKGISIKNILPIRLNICRVESKSAFSKMEIFD